MNDEQIDSLFARYVEHLVVHGVAPELEGLASGDAEVVAALRERIAGFERISEALQRRLEPLTGRTVAGYRFGDRLGEGGMGQVYRAEDLELGREVAIKVLPHILALDPARRARFEREAQILAALDHPHIAAIHKLERSEGLEFLVLELVEGETLGERIGRGALPPGEALPLFIEIARALEATHAKGILHRDLKPANIMITTAGHAKVLDFGLGKVFGAQVSGALGESLEQSLQGTVTGLILGTAAYMSPEQARGEEVDRQGDIWSFGCVLFEALSGVQAFRGANFLETVAAILEREPPWERLPAETPASLRTLLRRCLEKNADRRLHDIADARLELEDALAPGRPKGFSRRLSIPLAAGLGLAITAGLLWLGRSERPANDSATSERRSSLQVSPGEPTWPLGSEEAYRGLLHEARTRWLASFEQDRGEPAASIPYLVYVSMRRPPALGILDGATWELLATIAVENPENADLIGGVAVTPDGTRSYVANSNQDAVFLIDTVARRREAVPRTGRLPVREEPYLVALSPDGRRAYVGASAGYVSVVDTDPASPSYHEILSVPGGDAIVVGRHPRGLAITSDGKRLYVANALSDSVSVIDTDSGSDSYHTVLAVPEGSAVPVGSEPYGIALAPDDRRAYVTSTLENSVSILDLDPKSSQLHTVVGTLAVGISPFDIATTADGTRAYVVARDSHDVAIVDLASQALVPARIPVREAPRSIAIDAADRYAYVTNHRSRDVSVIDIDPASASFHTVVATVPVPGLPVALAIGAPPGR